MAVATSTAILIAAAVGGVAAGGQAVQANQQRQAAKGAANKADDANKKMQAEGRARQANEEGMAKNMEVRNAARQRSRALSFGNQGRASTIMTGNGGLPGAPNTATKTLLGQ